MSRYYYAGGRRIDLEPDEEHVAIDQASAKAAGLEADVSSGAAGASQLPGGVVLLRRAAMTVPSLTRLRRAGAVRPVFRRDRALVVALPDVRIEFDTAKARRAVMDAVARSPHPVTISEDTETRLVLRPSSGDADEALAIANYVYEHAHPAAASVRFVQIVPKREA